MSRAIVVPVIRELARCYQAFQRASDANIRRMGLTPPQFDIVVTLGNTPGMSFKELGSRTLITKGTLTGVVDRLEARGLVERQASQTDGRSTRKNRREIPSPLFWKPMRSQGSRLTWQERRWAGIS